MCVLFERLLLRITIFVLFCFLISFLPSRNHNFSIWFPEIGIFWSFRFGFTKRYLLLIIEPIISVCLSQYSSGFLFLLAGEGIVSLNDFSFQVKRPHVSVHGNMTSLLAGLSALSFFYRWVVRVELPPFFLFHLFSLLLKFFLVLFVVIQFFCISDAFTFCCSFSYTFFVPFVQFKKRFECFHMELVFQCQYLLKPCVFCAEH